MKNIIKKISILTLVVIMLLSVFSGCSNEKKVAMENYNTECARISEEYDSLQKVIEESNALLQSGEKPFDENLLKELETAITDANSRSFEIPKASGNADEINNLVENEVKKISYSDIIDNLEKNKINLENSIKVLKQVTNPSEEFIVNCIKNINGVTGYSAVTEDNDPNGMLNKTGGYTSTVYFSYDKVNVSFLDGTIIENGTDGGGSIEVYSTEEDVNKRNDYLASFDGGILSSGSHTVVGTVLVRTSNYLTASQQKELENAIIEKLTELN